MEMEVVAIIFRFCEYVRSWGVPYQHSFSDSHVFHDGVARIDKKPISR